MESYDQARPAGVRENPPIEGISWAEAAYYKRIHGNNVRLPAHMAHFTLAELEARAREEGRAEREVREAKESAARIEAAPKSIERALLDGPSSKQARPQRGWRQRVRYLNLFRRCRSHREAATRLGVDESTVRRWRRKYPAFGARCDEIAAERFRQNTEDLKLRAGEPRVRPIFFRGKQVGEQVTPDDRALMFLLKLEDARQARAEAREERREQRAHEIRLKEMEIEARHAAKALPKTHASAAHSAAPVDVDSSSESNALAPVVADIAPHQVAEVRSSDDSLVLSATEGAVNSAGVGERKGPVAQRREGELAPDADAMCVGGHRPTSPSPLRGSPPSPPAYDAGGEGTSGEVEAK